MFSVEYSLVAEKSVVAWSVFVDNLHFITYSNQIIQHLHVRAKMQSESGVTKWPLWLIKLFNPLDWLYRALSLFPLHYIRLSPTSGMIDAQIGMKDVFQKYY